MVHCLSEIYRLHLSLYLNLNLTIIQLMVKFNSILKFLYNSLIKTDLTGKIVLLI